MSSSSRPAPILPPILEARGWPIFPLYEAIGPACSCVQPGCTSPGKHPRNRTGVTAATTDRGRVLEWLVRWPTCAWGVACGGPARLLVLDVDTRPGVDGQDTLRALGTLPDCPTVETGSGGRHYYLRLPDGVGPVRNSAGVLGPGLDVRTDGGYVVAPGSPHVSGRPYRWLEHEDLPLPDAPAWLVDRLTRRAEPARRSVAPGVVRVGRHQWLLDTTARMVAWGLPDAAIRAAVRAAIPEKLDLSDGRVVTDREVDDAIRGARAKGFDEEDQGALAAAGLASAEALGREGDRAAASPGPKAVARVPALVELLDRATGPLRLLADYCLSDAHRPQPEIALGAALATWSAVLGGRVQLADATRTNLYLVAVASSGAGKDAPRNACKRALSAAGLDEVVGADSWASHAGLHAQVQAQPRSVSFLDELGKMVAAMVNDKAPQHVREIVNVLLKVYGNSADLYLGARYKDSKGDVRVSCPHLSLLGTTTHGTLFGSLNREALNDGLLARTLLFTVSDDLPPKRHRVRRMLPPADLVGALKRWHAFSAGDVGVRCQEVPVTNAAEDVLVAYSDECDALVRSEPGSPVRSLYTRCHASAKKVALVHACASGLPDDREEGPLLDATSAEWAVAFVRHCTDYAVRECRRSVGETPHEKKLISLLQHVRENPGQSLTELRDTWQRVPPKERNELLHELVDSRRVVLIERRNPRGPTTTIITAV